MLYFLPLMITSASYKAEMIVSTTYNVWDEKSAASIVNRAKENNIDIISLLFKQDEDENAEENIPERKSGSTLYPSDIVNITVLPEFKTDFLTDLIKLAHKSGIKIKAWVPQFHDQVAFDLHNEWGMIAINKNKETYQFKGTNANHAEYFVNPINEEVQKYEISILEEIVTKFDVDMVVLDWVRFDSYNMDLSDYSIQKWMDYDEKKRDPKQFDFDPTDNTDWETVGQWNSWRTDVMGAYVVEASKKIKAIRPTVKVGAYVLSPYWEECGQDIAKFKDAVDFVAPMCYFKDFNEKVDWVYKEGGIVDLCAKKVGSDSKVVPVFSFSDKIEPGVSDDATWKTILENLASKFPNIDTISFFYWTYWQDEMYARANAVRNLVSLSGDDDSSHSDEHTHSSSGKETPGKSEDYYPDDENGAGPNVIDKATTIVIASAIIGAVVIGVAVTLFIVFRKRRRVSDDPASVVLA